MECNWIVSSSYRVSPHGWDADFSGVPEPPQLDRREFSLQKSISNKGERNDDRENGRKFSAPQSEQEFLPDCESQLYKSLLTKSCWCLDIHVNICINVRISGHRVGGVCSTGDKASGTHLLPSLIIRSPFMQALLERESCSANTALDRFDIHRSKKSLADGEQNHQDFPLPYKIGNEG